MGYHWIILLLPAFFARGHGSCGAPPRLDIAGLEPEFIDRDNFDVGAQVNYTCRNGYIRIPGIQTFITCLSNSTWSTPQTFCQKRECPIPSEIENGRMEITDRLFGSRVNYTCDLGYRMISRRNYIECQADGRWSSEVPVCEAQVCPPPDAIPDGTFDPDKEEYNYQDAVRYTCNDNKATLIGERTLSCTANGNWSSDSPRCKVVECSDPDVKNGNKISGFTGPYNLNSAVRFECSRGFVMEGEPFVKCNASAQWEPSLPTCRSLLQQPPQGTATPSPAATKVKETEAEGIVTQSPAATKEREAATVSNNSSPTTKEREAATMSNNSSPTTKEKETETGGSTPVKEKDENNGAGSNIGAIVGGVIAGILGILLAAIIYVWWFKKSRGGVYVAGKKHESVPSSSHQTNDPICDMKQIDAQLKGLSNNRKTEPISSESNTTPVRSFNGTELQYHTQPADKCGAAF